MNSVQTSLGLPVSLPLLLPDTDPDDPDDIDDIDDDDSGRAERMVQSYCVSCLRGQGDVFDGFVMVERCAVSWCCVRVGIGGAIVVLSSPLLLGCVVLVSGCDVMGLVG